MKVLAVTTLLLLNVHVSSQAADPPYSREADLQEVEMKIRKSVERSSSGSAKEKETFRVYQLVWADRRCLQDLSDKKDWAGLVKAATEMDARWRNDSPEVYVGVLSVASRSLYYRDQIGQESAALVQRFATNVLERLPVVPLAAAGEALGFLAYNLGHGQGELPTVMDTVPRQMGLNAFLGVVSRVDALVSIPRTNAFIGMTERERDSLAGGNYPLTMGGVTTLNLKERYRELLQFLQDHRTFDVSPADHTNDHWSGHQGKLEKSLTGFLQKRYGHGSADLDEVQLALEKHLTNSVLRERVVLAAYKGTNPFTGRVLGPKPLKSVKPTPASDDSAEAKSNQVPATSAGSPEVGKKKPKGVQVRPSDSLTVVAVTAPQAADLNAKTRAFGWFALGCAALIGLILWRARRPSA